MGSGSLPKCQISLQKKVEHLSSTLDILLEQTLVLLLLLHSLEAGVTKLCKDG